MYSVWQCYGNVNCMYIILMHYNTVEMSSISTPIPDDRPCMVCICNILVFTYKCVRVGVSVKGKSNFSNRIRSRVEELHFASYITTNQRRANTTKNCDGRTFPSFSPSFCELKCTLRIIKTKNRTDSLLVRASCMLANKIYCSAMRLHIRHPPQTIYNVYTLTHTHTHKRIVSEFP